MADKLSQEQGLKQIITRLNNSNAKLRLEKKVLEGQPELLKQRGIKQLELELEDREGQRKNLQNKLYEAKQ